MGNWTNNGLTAVAALVQSAITYVGISPGCGTLSAGISSGVARTSLPIDAPGIPAAIAAGQSLTVTDGTNSETVTCNGGALAGATSIPIYSWTPAHNYTIHVAGVCPTPAASDTTLYAESQRVPVAAANPGGTPGESLIAGYCDGTQPTAVYLLVGFFGGSGATGSVGTGTLMAEDIVVWNHTLNVDTFMYQGDGLI